MTDRERSRGPETLDEVLARAEGGRVGRLLRAAGEDITPAPRFARALEERLHRAATAPPAGSDGAAPRRWSPLRAHAAFRAVGAALVALLLLGGGMWASPSARAQFGRVAWLVPGLGLRAADTPGLTAVAPVIAARDGLTLTVLALRSADGRTQVRLQIAGVPFTRPGEASPVGALRLTLRDAAGRDYPASGGAPASQGIVPQGPATPGAPPATLTLGVEQPFAPLDPAVRAVEVRVDAPPPVGTWVVRVPVAPDAAGGLAVAGPGGAGVTIGGITLRVAGVAADEHGLAVQVAAQPGGGARAVRALGEVGHPARRLTLRDERGRELVETPPTFSAPGADAAGILTDDMLFPPLAPGSRATTLTVPTVIVAETGETAPLRIPLAGARSGDVIPLDATLAVGPYPVHVTGAEIVDRAGTRTLLLHLELGGGPPGRRLLGFAGATLDGQTTSPNATEYARPGASVQADAIGVPLPVGIGDTATITLRDPLVAVDGPWQLPIPLPVAP